MDLLSIFLDFPETTPAPTSGRARLAMYRPSPHQHVLEAQDSRGLMTEGEAQVDNEVNGRRFASR